MLACENYGRETIAVIDSVLTGKLLTRARARGKVNTGRYRSVFFKGECPGGQPKRSHIKKYIRSTNST